MAACECTIIYNDYYNHTMCVLHVYNYRYVQCYMELYICNNEHTVYFMCIVLYVYVFTCGLCTTVMNIIGIQTYIYIYRCYGNVRLNNDSKSRRRTLDAWCVILNCIDMRGGQSVRDEK